MEVEKIYFVFGQNPLGKEKADLEQINIYMSRLRACGPVIPGIPRLAGDNPARYASGRYGDQVHYGDGILFLFVGGHTH